MFKLEVTGSMREFDRCQALASIAVYVFAFLNFGGISRVGSRT